MTTTIAESPTRRDGVLPFWRAVADSLEFLPPGETIHHTGASWLEYQFLMECREVRFRKVRIQYDRGDIEIMSTSNWHEIWKCVLGQLLVIYMDEIGVNHLPVGEMTVSQIDLDRGFEPDESYYLKNAHLMLPMRDLDLTVDPPPDLTIEIEYSCTVKNRMAVFAAFKIPEVWRFNGSELTTWQLQPDGEYLSMPRSLAFPNLDLEKVAEFVLRAQTQQMLELRREFREWVRAEANL